MFAWGFETHQGQEAGMKNAGPGVLVVSPVARSKRKGADSRNELIDCEVYPLKRQFLPLALASAHPEHQHPEHSKRGRSDGFETLEEKAYSYRVHRDASNSSSSDDEEAGSGSFCYPVSDTEIEGAVLGSPLGKRAANYNIADEIVEDLIRKTRKSALHSTAAGGAGGRRAVGAGFLPGWGDPTADRRRGLLLLPPPPPPSSTWQGTDRDDTDCGRLPDYIGDSAGTIYSTRRSGGGGYGFANTPSHQEFCCCVEELESAGAGAGAGARNGSELMSIDE